MAIGNVELMHECIPKHSRIYEWSKTTEEGEKRGVSMERST